MRHFSNGLDGDWNRVTGTAPCPVCGSDANCRTHSDEAFVCCVQRPSDWRLSNGGWLHRLEASSTVSAGYGFEHAAFREADTGPSGARP
jgi:hypothetical protein